MDLTRPWFVDDIGAMPDALPIIDSTDAVIDELGGNGPVSRLLNTTHKAVSNWRGWGRGRFPADTYLVLTAALERSGRRADPRLWGMIGSETEAA